MCTAHTKAPCDSGDDDDIWADSSDDGHVGASQRELDREAAARHQHFYNAGYRDGLEEGKEHTLQEGFNAGFKEGAAAGLEWGLLRGTVKTLAAMDGRAAATRGMHDQIRALQSAAEVSPRAAMLATYRRVLSSPPLQQQLTPQHNQPQPSTQLLNRPAEALPARHQQNCAAPWAGPDLARQSQAADDAARGATSASLTCSSSDMWVSANGVFNGAGASTVGDRQQRQQQLADGSAAMAVVATAAEQSPAVAEAPAALPEVRRAGRTRRAAGATPAPPSGGGAATAAGAAVLPPDAAALELPDMPAIMRSLRTGLVSLGFQVGSASLPGARWSSEPRASGGV